MGSWKDILPLTAVLWYLFLRYEENQSTELVLHLYIRSFLAKYYDQLDQKLYGDLIEQLRSHALHLLF